MNTINRKIDLDWGFHLATTQQAFLACSRSAVLHAFLMPSLQAAFDPEKKKYLPPLPARGLLFVHIHYNGR